MVFDKKKYQQYSSVKRILPVSQSVLSFKEKDIEKNKMRIFESTGGESFHSKRYIFESLESKSLDINQNISKYFFGDSYYIFSDCLGTDFYDYYHLMNIAGQMKNFADSIGHDRFGAVKKLYYRTRGDILDPVKISLVGRFCERDRSRRTLFFSDNDNVYPSDSLMFFKYLFYKYKTDFNIFNDFSIPDRKPLDHETHLVTCNRRNEGTFRRWGKNLYNGIPLILNPSMVCRLGQINNDTKCFNGMTIKERYNSDENLKMEVIDHLLKEYLEIIEEFYITLKGSGIKVKLGSLGKAVGFAAGAATGGPVAALAAAAASGSGTGEGNPYPQGESDESILGGSKRTKRKIKRTGKKIRRTNKKMKRTNLKMKRTDKKRKNKKRTNKKRVYNP